MSPLITYVKCQVDAHQSPAVLASTRRGSAEQAPNALKIPPVSEHSLICSNASENSPLRSRLKTPIGLLGVSGPVALALSVLRGRDALELRGFEPFEEPDLESGEVFWYQLEPEVLEAE